MSDVPVYMIANLVTNEDPSEYRTYEKGFFPILKKYYLNTSDKIAFVFQKGKLEKKLIMVIR